MLSSPSPAKKILKSQKLITRLRKVVMKRRKKLEKTMMRRRLTNDVKRKLKIFCIMIIIILIFYTILDIKNLNHY